MALKMSVLYAALLRTMQYNTLVRRCRFHGDASSIGLGTGQSSSIHSYCARGASELHPFRTIKPNLTLFARLELRSVVNYTINCSRGATRKIKSTGSSQETRWKCASNKITSCTCNNSPVAELSASRRANEITFQEAPNGKNLLANTFYRRTVRD